MKRKFLVTLAVLIAASSHAFAQNVSDLIISEAAPDGVIVDGYGRMSGYIEVYNTSMGTVNIGGCYLTDDRSDLRKSLIQNGYSKCKIGPNQCLVFFASGRGDDGVDYAGFTLRRGGTVYLVSNDGKTVVDSLTIPQGLPEGMAVEKIPADAKGIVHVLNGEPAEPSPYMRNGNSDSASGSIRMAKTDPHGLILTVVAVSVVFLALAILWFLFWVLFERPAKMKAEPVRKKAPKSGKSDCGEVAAAVAMAMDLESGGDAYAAIATALHLYLNDTVHDRESFVITIRHPESSNWTNKTQTFRRMPR